MSSEHQVPWQRFTSWMPTALRWIQKVDTVTRCGGPSEGAAFGSYPGLSGDVLCAPIRKVPPSTRWKQSLLPMPSPHHISGGGASKNGFDVWTGSRPA